MYFTNEISDISSGIKSVGIETDTRNYKLRYILFIQIKPEKSVLATLAFRSNQPPFAFLWSNQPLFVWKCVNNRSHAIRSTTPFDLVEINLKSPHHTVHDNTMIDGRTAAFSGCL